MKRNNNWVIRVSQLMLGSAIIALIFLAGAWVGKANFEFAWDIAFASVLGLSLFGALLWILGFNSKSPKKKAEKIPEPKDVEVIDHDI